MSLLPYSLARPFLFRLDPESAHELTMRSLARLQGTPLERAYAGSMVDDPIELAGLRFPEPGRPGRGPGQERALHRRAWAPWASASSRSAP